MRKAYLDNIRWVTVVLVVIFHVLYMYNAEGIPGVAGRITKLPIQYYDAIQYFLHPWFMMTLFIVSGICSRLYLASHTDRDFVRSRTDALLVPSTIGLFVFQFLQGYLNTRSNDAAEMMQTVPVFARYLILVASGVGVLWYIQLLWLFSMALLPIRRIDQDRLWNVCAKVNGVHLLLLFLPVWGAAQILNTPIVSVYRFGLYFTVYLLGYFVFSHEEVIATLKRWFVVFCPLSLALGTAFTILYFGRNYGDQPVNRTALYIAFGWFASLAVLGGFARFFDRETVFTSWMRRRSFGLYVFHYLGISAVGVYLAQPGRIPAWAAYLLSLIAGFGGAYMLNAVISRLPFFRWAVLGIRRQRQATGKE